MRNQALALSAYVLWAQTVVGEPPTEAVTMQCPGDRAIDSPEGAQRENKILTPDTAEEVLH